MEPETSVNRTSLNQELRMSKGIVRHSINQAASEEDALMFATVASSTTSD